MKLITDEINQFLNRWDIPNLKINDIDEIHKFKNRLSGFLLSSSIWFEKEGADFFNRYGIQKSPPLGELDIVNHTKIVIDTLYNEIHFFKFLEKLEFILNNISYYHTEIEGIRYPHQFLNEQNRIFLEKVVDISSINVSVSFQSVKSNKPKIQFYTCKFYPRGDKQLDNPHIA